MWHARLWPALIAFVLLSLAALALAGCNATDGASHIPQMMSPAAG